MVYTFCDACDWILRDPTQRFRCYECEHVYCATCAATMMATGADADAPHPLCLQCLE